MTKMYDGFFHSNFIANPLNSKRSFFKKCAAIRWKNSGCRVSLFGQMDF